MWYGLGYGTGPVRSLGCCMATLHLTAGGGGGAAGAPGEATLNGAALCANLGTAEAERVWSPLDASAQLAVLR